MDSSFNVFLLILVNGFVIDLAGNCVDFDIMEYM